MPVNMAIDRKPKYTQNSYFAFLFPMMKFSIKKIVNKVIIIKITIPTNPYKNYYFLMDYSSSISPLFKKKVLKPFK